MALGKSPRTDLLGRNETWVLLKGNNDTVIMRWRVAPQWKTLVLLSFYYISREVTLCMSNKRNSTVPSRHAISVRQSSFSRRF